MQLMTKTRTKMNRKKAETRNRMRTKTKQKTRRRINGLTRKPSAAKQNEVGSAASKVSKRP